MLHRVLISYLIQQEGRRLEIEGQFRELIINTQLRLTYDENCHNDHGSERKRVIPPPLSFSESYNALYVSHQPCRSIGPADISRNSIRSPSTGVSIVRY